MPLTNWYQTFSFTPDTEIEVANHTAPWLADQILQAEASHKSVRAVGSAWSSGDVMATDGVAISLASHNQILGFARGDEVTGGSPVLGAARLASVIGSGERLVHVQAGIRIHDLITALADEHGSCIPNVGASSGQTIAGAIGTSSHGGAFNRSPLSDSVRAIFLMGPGGRKFWIERRRGRISDNVAFDTILTNEELPYYGAELVYDDELFHAAQVSVGSLGVVLEVVLSVSEMLAQSQVLIDTLWSEVREKLLDESLFTDVTGHPTEQVDPIREERRAITPVPEGIELIINPYRTSNDYDASTFDRGCTLVLRAVGPNAEPMPFPSSGDAASNLVNYLGGLAAPALDVIGVNGYHAIVDFIRANGRAASNGYVATHQLLETYAGGPPEFRFPGLSVELAISTKNNRHVALVDQLLAAFDDIIRENPGKLFAGFFSVRFTKPSMAHLAMQRIEDPAIRVCHIEIFTLKELTVEGFQHDGNAEGWSEVFVRAFVNIGEAAGARLHWGQEHHLDRYKVILDYGNARNLHDFRRAKTRITKAGRSTTFSSAFTRRTGLEGYHEELAAAPNYSRTANNVHLFAHAPGGVLRRMVLSGPSGGEWESIGEVSLGDVAGPLTAASSGPGVIDLFAETVDRRIKHMRWDGAWTSETKPIFTSDGDLVEVRGPLSAASVKGTLHLFGVGSNGAILWIRPGPKGAWLTDRIIPDLPSKAGRFRYRVSACADDNGALHVVGLSTKRRLLHGRFSPRRGWKFEVIIPEVHTHLHPHYGDPEALKYFRLFRVSCGWIFSRPAN